MFFYLILKNKSFYLYILLIEIFHVKYLQRDAPNTSSRPKWRDLNYYLFTNNSKLYNQKKQGFPCFLLIYYFSVNLYIAIELAIGKLKAVYVFTLFYEYRNCTF